MSLEAITQQVGVWISQYVAGFCLFSILAWAAVSYLRTPQWERPVRDAGVFFLVIGTLTLVLALRPPAGDVSLWTPITWFCFAMLIVMELLWVAFLTEAIVQAMIALPSKLREAPAEPPYPSKPSLP